MAKAGEPIEEAEKTNAGEPIEEALERFYVDRGLSISKTQIIEGVYEGTFFNRSVAVRRLGNYEENYQIAKLELRNHLLCESSSLHILNSHGCVHFDQDYTYLYLEAFKCTLEQAVILCATEGTVKSSLPPTSIQFLEKQFGERSVFWQHGSPVMIKIIKAVISCNLL